MSQTNYQRELDRILREQGARRPSVLLHSCCGPCSSSVLEYLTQYFDITLLWYNPNLFPQEEFDRRYRTQLQLIDRMGLSDRVSVLAEPWQHEVYAQSVRGLENEPEGGGRCEVCFRLRLREAARLARHYGFDYFCTTLTLSRYKNAQLINRLGQEIADEEGVAWLPSDFKKQGREARSVQLARQYELYQQNYCGCEFSLRDRAVREQNAT